MLRVTARNTENTVSLKLEGSLKGPWVDELHRAWLAEAGSSGHSKDIYVDLASVNFADSKGTELLALMQKKGVIFIGLSTFLQQLMQVPEPEKNSGMHVE